MTFEKSNIGSCSEYAHKLEQDYGPLPPGVIEMFNIYGQITATMKYENLIIEKKEYVLLKRYMNLSGYYKDETMRKSVKKLIAELSSAQIFDEGEMPKDVIRFNSTITIVSDNGWRKKFKLVSPVESDIIRDLISILTPMGLAVIGYAEGDTLAWELPSGEQKLTIERVEQKNKYINANIIL